MQHKKSDELIVAMMVEPMIYRTCAAGCRGRRYEEKTQLSEGVLALERVKGFSTITSIRLKKKKPEKYLVEKSSRQKRYLDK